MSKTNKKTTGKRGKKTTNRRYEITVTGGRGNKTKSRRVTSRISGRSYTVAKVAGREWTCECKTFWDNIRVGADDPHCWHIKECIEDNYERNGGRPSCTVTDDAPVRRRDPPVDVVACDIPVCTACGATEHTKSGTRKGRQLYLCKSCGRRYFQTEPGFAGNKYPPEVVAGSLNMLMSGMSYRQVSDHVKTYFGAKVAHTTILYWTKKYTALIKSYVDALRPVIGCVWSIDEAVINVKRTNRIEGKGLADWLWTAIDPKTRLILATRITSDSRTGDDVSKLIGILKSMYDDPRYAVSDSLAAYIRPLRQELPGTAHLKTKAIASTLRFTNMAIERYHNEIREKTKVCRGMGNDESAQVFCDLLRIHHNFVRPHMGLDGRTPAEEAGMITPGVAKGKYRTLIPVAASKGRRVISDRLGRYNKKAEISVGETDTRIIPKMWLDNDDWGRINTIMTGLGFVWMFNAYARYWICAHNAPQPLAVPDDTASTGSQSRDLRG